MLAAIADHLRIQICNRANGTSIPDDIEARRSSSRPRTSPGGSPASHPSMTRAIAGFVALLVVTPFAGAQTSSLRESVRERQADIELIRGCGIFSRPVVDTAAAATVLVHGVIESSRAVLSLDETKVMTEVTLRTIDVHRVFDGRNWSSPPQVMTLQTIGGVAVVENFQVIHSLTRIGWKVLPREGQEVIFLASPGNEPDQLIFNHYGAFVVETGRVYPMGTLAQGPKSVLVDAFMSNLRRMLGAQAAANRTQP